MLLFFKKQKKKQKRIFFSLPRHAHMSSLLATAQSGNPYIYGCSMNLDTIQDQIRKLSRNIRKLCEQLQQQEKHHQWLQRKSLEIQKITKNSSFSIGFFSFFHLGFSAFCGKNKIVFTYVVMGCTQGRRQHGARGGKCPP